MSKSRLFTSIFVLLIDLFLLIWGLKNKNTILVIAGIVGLGIFISYFRKDQPAAVNKNVIIKLSQHYNSTQATKIKEIVGTQANG